MKFIGALLAAVSTAALVFDLEFLFEGLLAGVGMSPSIFIFGFALNLLIGLPVALVGGLPAWLIFRHWKIHSPWTFALAGASLALLTYLLLVAAGMGQPSDHPMTFAENLGRSFHIPRIAFVMLAGASGAVVFWRFARGPVIAEPVTT
jgi:hypothetical protein